MEDKCRDEILFCPCWKVSDIGGPFQLLANLKNAGLEVYRYLKTDDAGAVGEDAPCNTDETYIVECANSIHLTSSEFARELDSNLISCPRCRCVVEQAKKVLKNVVISNEVQTLGVCARCLSPRKSYCKCHKVVQQFIGWKEKQKDESQQVLNKWFLQIDTVLRNIRNRDSFQKVTRTRSYSDFQHYIDRTQLEPKQKQMPVTRGPSFDYLLNIQQRSAKGYEIRSVSEAYSFVAPKPKDEDIESIITKKKTHLEDLKTKKFKRYPSFNSLTTVTSKLSRRSLLKGDFKYFFPKKRAKSKHTKHHDENLHESSTEIIIENTDKVKQRIRKAKKRALQQKNKTINIKKVIDNLKDEKDNFSAERKEQKKRKQEQHKYQNEKKSVKKNKKAELPMKEKLQRQRFLDNLTKKKKKVTLNIKKIKVEFKLHKVKSKTAETNDRRKLLTDKKKEKKLKKNLEKHARNKTPDRNTKKKELQTAYSVKKKRKQKSGELMDNKIEQKRAKEEPKLIKKHHIKEEKNNIKLRKKSYDALLLTTTQDQKKDKLNAKKTDEDKHEKVDVKKSKLEGLKIEKDTETTKNNEKNYNIKVMADYKNKDYYETKALEQIKQEQDELEIKEERLDEYDDKKNIRDRSTTDKEIVTTENNEKLGDKNKEQKIQTNLETQGSIDKMKEVKTITQEKNEILDKRNETEQKQINEQRSQEEKSKKEFPKNKESYERNKQIQDELKAKKYEEKIDRQDKKDSQKNIPDGSKMKKETVTSENKEKIDNIKVMAELTNKKDIKKEQKIKALLERQGIIDKTKEITTEKVGLENNEQIQQTEDSQKNIPDGSKMGKEIVTNENKEKVDNINVIAERMSKKDIKKEQKIKALLERQGIIDKTKGITTEKEGLENDEQIQEKEEEIQEKEDSQKNIPDGSKMGKEIVTNENKEKVDNIKVMAERMSKKDIKKEQKIKALLERQGIIDKTKEITTEKEGLENDEQIQEKEEKIQEKEDSQKNIPDGSKMGKEILTSENKEKVDNIKVMAERMSKKDIKKEQKIKALLERQGIIDKSKGITTEKEGLENHEQIQEKEEEIQEKEDSQKNIPDGSKMEKEIVTSENKEKVDNIKVMAERMSKKDIKKEQKIKALLERQGIIDKTKEITIEKEGLENHEQIQEKEEENIQEKEDSQKNIPDGSKMKKEIVTSENKEKIDNIKVMAERMSKKDKKKEQKIKALLERQGIIDKTKEITTEKEELKNDEQIQEKEEKIQEKEDSQKNIPGGSKMRKEVVSSKNKEKIDNIKVMAERMSKKDKKKEQKIKALLERQGIIDKTKEITIEKEGPENDEQIQEKEEEIHEIEETIQDKEGSQKNIPDGSKMKKETVTSEIKEKIDNIKVMAERMSKKDKKKEQKIKALLERQGIIDKTKKITIEKEGLENDEQIQEKEEEVQEKEETIQEKEDSQKNIPDGSKMGREIVTSENKEKIDNIKVMAERMSKKDKKKEQKIKALLERKRIIEKTKEITTEKDGLENDEQIQEKEEEIQEKEEKIQEKEDSQKNIPDGSKMGKEIVTSENKEKIDNIKVMAERMSKKDIKKEQKIKALLERQGILDKKGITAEKEGLENDKQIQEKSAPEEEDIEEIRRHGKGNNLKYEQNISKHEKKIHDTDKKGEKGKIKKKLQKEETPTLKLKAKKKGTTLGALVLSGKIAVTKVIDEENSTARKDKQDYSKKEVKILQVKHEKDKNGSKHKLRKQSKNLEADITNSKLIKEQKAKAEKEARDRANSEANADFIKALLELKNAEEDKNKQQADEIEQKNKEEKKKGVADSKSKIKEGVSDSKSKKNEYLSNFYRNIPEKGPARVPLRKYSQDKQSMKKVGDETEIVVPFTKIKIQKPHSDDLILQLVKISKEPEHQTKDRDGDRIMADLVEKIHRVHESKKRKHLMIAEDSDIELEVLRQPELGRRLIIGNKIEKVESILSVQREMFGKSQMHIINNLEMNKQKSDAGFKEAMTIKISDYGPPKQNISHIAPNRIPSQTGHEDFKYVVIKMNKENDEVSAKKRRKQVTTGSHRNAHFKEQKYIQDRLGSQKDKMKFAKGDGIINSIMEERFIMTPNQIHYTSSSSPGSVISDISFKSNKQKQQNVSKFTVPSYSAMAYEKKDVPGIPMNEIKVQRAPDNVILELIKLTNLSSISKPDIDMRPIIDKAHENYLAKRKINKELEENLETDSSPPTPPAEDQKKEIVFGRKITETQSINLDSTVEHTFPIKKYDFETRPIKSEAVLPKQSKEKPRKKSKKYDEEAVKGVIHYSLSDREYIDRGWTLLPTEKVVRKMNVYRMRPAKPEFDWFERNKHKKMTYYDSGEKLAEIDDNGRGRWYYRNGKLAMDYYNAEEINAQQRIVIYSSGEPDEKGRTYPVTVLAMFDYVGNGVVFDHSGKIRLKYNQTEGVILDRNIGPVSNWKWHSLNDPPVLQQVMIDTQLAHKDPNILKLGPILKQTPVDNEEMLAIEFDNFIKEKSKKLAQSFKPYQIKMKALKINDHFSLRVLDQATVYLIFRDGTTNLKLNIGMILDHQEIIDTDTAELGDVSNSLERFPARTDSLEHLQKTVAHAQHVERMLLERDRRLRPLAPISSADQLVRAASRPLKPPITVSNCYNICRKTSCPNVYYNNRLI